MNVQPQTITFINIGVALMIAIFMYSGFKKGFLLKLLSILSFFVTGVIAWYLSEPCAKHMALYPKGSTPLANTMFETLIYDNLNRFLVFIVLFICLFVVALLLKPLFKMIGHIPVISIVNKLAGCALGGVQALLILLFVSLVLHLPFWDKGNQIVEKSVLRYSDKIASVALFSVEEPMKEVLNLHDYLQEGKTLDKKEIDNLQHWLEKQAIDKTKIEQFINSIRKGTI
ncbi:MAG: CvpA family protein [Longicatena sp.]